MVRDFTSNGRVGAGAGGSRFSSLSRWFLKPTDPDSPGRQSAKDRSVEELEHEHRYADDRERVIGLMLAPVAAALALLVVGVQAAHDPAVGVKGHVSTSLYGELLVVLLVLALVMLGAAWFRKRTYLGAASALYGLAIFNLHFWGFGVPFVMVGAWLLLHAYRAQRDYKEATGAGGGRGRRGAGSGPAASRRYTPPVSSGRGKAAASKGSGRRAS